MTYWTCAICTQRYTADHVSFVKKMLGISVVTSRTGIFWFACGLTAARRHWSRARPDYDAMGWLDSSEVTARSTQVNSNRDTGCASIRLGLEEWTVSLYPHCLSSFSCLTVYSDIYIYYRMFKRIFVVLILQCGYIFPEKLNMSAMGGGEPLWMVQRTV